MDVYRLPVHLRNFYYKQLVETKKRENEKAKEQQNKNSSKVRTKR
jgi:hypothetical protein